MNQESFSAQELADILRGGIYSVCSAHPWVIEAALKAELDGDRPVLIEATSNQVNQDGGYTHMQPLQFRGFVEAIARNVGFPTGRLILGGDHLGPNPWTSLEPEAAMQRAETMVGLYVQAGFRKIHLDASMPCAGEISPLLDDVIAERAARLCRAAEVHADAGGPVYVVGTEVPTPGGALEGLDELAVTTVATATAALSTHRNAFDAAGLSDAWKRIVALVVQPGVEFSQDTVEEYAPWKAKHLSEVLLRHPDLVFEAHSTDYQSPQSYSLLLRDGFRILKVGPALTYAMRQGLFALSRIAAELGFAPDLPQVLDEAMVGDDRFWKTHYHGDEATQRLLRRYSYSDRIRYYWHKPEVQVSFTKLLATLERVNIPLVLLAEFMPAQYTSVREGILENAPKALVGHAIDEALRPYRDATASMAPH